MDIDIVNFQPQKDIHILVVDPDPYSRRSLQETLLSCNYQVTVAEDASNALKLLAKGKYKFNIVMIDAHKDEANGFDFIKTATNMKLFTIYVSASRHDVFMKEGRTDGADLFLLKPVGLEIARHLWEHVFPRNIKVKDQKKMVKEKSYEYNNMGLDVNERLPNKKRRC